MPGIVTVCRTPDEAAELLRQAWEVAGRLEAEGAPRAACFLEAVKLLAGAPVVLPDSSGAPALNGLNIPGLIAPR